MTINFHPKAGSILICDFEGYVIPEIVKKRPVVVISPNHMRNSGLVTVVPFSTTPPNPIENFHYELLNQIKNDNTYHWAKCDLVARVRLERLDRVKVGKRTYATFYVSDEELQQIRLRVAMTIGIDINKLA